MKKSLVFLFLALGIMHAGDKVIISGYENYPTVSGCVSKVELNSYFACKNFPYFKMQYKLAYNLSLAILLI